MNAAVIDRDVALTVGFWKADGLTPAEAWDALGGSALRLVVTWENVQSLAGLRMAEMLVFRHERAS
ncbi:MAG TPA: hypothetical protein VGO34_14830 [Alphaproteobacteria bacterium]|jgi:hypothetical protein